MKCFGFLMNVVYDKTTSIGQYLDSRKELIATCCILLLMQWQLVCKNVLFIVAMLHRYDTIKFTDHLKR